MPTYEFRCPNGHQFDQFHRISDSPTVAACPTCGAEAQRVISGGAGLVFKGSGFYLTDYGKNAHRTSGPAKAGEGGSNGSSGESSSSEKSSEKASSDKPAADKSASASPGGSSGSGGSSGGASGGGSSGGSSGGSGGGKGGA